MIFYISLAVIAVLVLRYFGFFHSMRRTYLNVPFTEKDEAKRLGAKWDPSNRQWYVPAGASVSPFRHWIKREG